MMEMGISIKFYFLFKIGSTIDVEAIDIDFDGDIDLVLANRDSQKLHLFK